MRMRKAKKRISTMKRITRKQAAEKLGVTPQTISNYVQEGLLGGYKDKANTLYVNGDDLEKFAKKYKLISVSEKALDEKLKELKRAKDEVCNELADMRKSLVGKRVKGVYSRDVGRLIARLFWCSHVPGLKQREFEVLSNYLEGDDVEDLAEYYGLTINRIRQLLQKAFYRFVNRSQLIRTSMRTNCQLEHEVNQLTKRLDDLRKQYYELKQSKDEEAMDKTMIRPPKLFARSLSDCGLSVRVVNCLKAKDAYTIEDLMTVFHCLEDFKDMRNFGNKCCKQVEAFIESNHLVFKNPKESLEHFYYRQNKILIDNGIIN